MQNNNMNITNISKYSNKQIYLIIFIAFFIVRYAFIFLSGADNYSLHGDAPRYLEQSEQVLNCNFNFQTKFFTGAPFYPVYQALYKILFGAFWEKFHEFSFVFFMSLSGVFLFKIAILIFENKYIGFITAFIYCFFPMTLWWTHTFCQDTPFQYQLIFSIYFLLKGVKTNNLKFLIFSSILFSITFLTKSHILFFSPFIVLYIFYNSTKDYKTKLFWCAIYTLICLVFTLPYGLYQLKTNGHYIISSNGLGGHFLSGHNEDLYQSFVAPPPLNSPQYDRIKAMDYDITRKLEDTLKTLDIAQKQDLFLKEGIKWCTENPSKFWHLTWMDFYRFLSPGVHKGSYPLKQWLFSFIISAPIYIFAYLSIIYLLIKNFRKNIWIFGLVLTMIIFSCVFYVQNRFRTITLEPYYIIYASYGIYYFFAFIKDKRYQKILKK